MFCRICKRIFSEPRTLDFGTYYPWPHTAGSFAISRRAGCPLCSVVWDSLCQSHSKHNDISFPLESVSADSSFEATYAFKALNAEWARQNKGSPWLVPADEPDNDDDSERIHALRAEVEGSINHLAKLLKTRSGLCEARSMDYWLVMEFQSSYFRLVLPMEEKTSEDVEQLCQSWQGNPSIAYCTQNMQLASAWLQKCREEHVGCLPDTQKTTDWLPTRLIDVGKHASSTPYIVETANLPKQVSYAALSHCWGDTQQMRLTRDLMESYWNEVPEAHLSATIRDAIQITRTLGFQYLWLDSLCILQDSGKDWHSEAAIIDQVYGYAACTIVAAHTNNGSGGCFANQNNVRTRQCEIPNPFSTERDSSFTIRSQWMGKIYENEVQNSPWYHRGWVSQERIFSRRLLIFGKSEMIWACQKLHACETWPSGKDGTNYIDRFEGLVEEKQLLQALCTKNWPVDIGDTTWWSFILQYTCSGLAKSSDRLMALHGLAMRIINATQRVYVAGHWMDRSLPISLLWRAITPGKPSDRSKLYRAPTWSWASIDGPISFETTSSETSKVLIRVHGTVPLKCPNLASMLVPVANLKISGYLLEVKLRMVAGPKLLASRDLFDLNIQPMSMYTSTTPSAEYDRTTRAIYYKPNTVPRAGGKAARRVQPDKEVHEWGQDMGAECYPDTVCECMDEIPALFMPLVQRRNIEGLLLRPAHGLSDHYERVGSFSWPGFGINDFLKEAKSRTIVLM